MTVSTTRSAGGGQSLVRNDVKPSTAPDWLPDHQRARVGPVDKKIDLD